MELIKVSLENFFWDEELVLIQIGVVSTLLNAFPPNNFGKVVITESSAKIKENCCIKALLDSKAL